MPPDRPGVPAVFGRNLRAARAARGWSQYRAAAEAGVGHATVQRAEDGRPVSLDTAVRLAAAYGTTLDTLLGVQGSLFDDMEAV